MFTEATPLDEINLGFGRLIDTARTTANTVYVCSVLPTIDNKNNERREKENEIIRATCEEKDNDLNFTYRDGSCDEAAFVKDGIHLSAHGLTKLLSNISLSQPKQPPTSRTTKNTLPSRQGPPPKKPRDAGGDGPLRTLHGGQ